MRRIEVCVGSSCFLKGAYRVLDTFTALTRQHGLESQVDVVGAFCMEHCQLGVSVQIDGNFHSVPDIPTARALFEQHVLNDAENQT